MKSLRLFLFLIVFYPIATYAQEEGNWIEGKQIEFEEWRKGFVAEVSDIEDPYSEFNAIFEELRFANNLSFVERYQKCRKLVRLAYTDQVHNKIRYPQHLRVLGNHFWKHYNDTILAATLLLESNRLLIEDNLTLDNVGEIHTSKTVSLFAKFKNDREAALNMLWPAAYLFGNHGTATRLLCDLADSYFDHHDYLAANFYLKRAEQWKNAYVNDANTNFAIYFTNQLSIYDELQKRNLIYQQYVFQSDLTPLAQQVRMYLLPIMEATQAGDIVSAYFFRELGLDFMNKHEYSYAIRYYMRSVNDFRTSSLNKGDLLFYANTCYYMGLSARSIGDNQKAKQAFSEAIEIAKKYEKLTTTNMSSRIMLAQTMLDLNENYSAQKLIRELEDILLDDNEYYLDFLPYIGFDFKNLQQSIKAITILYLHLKGLSLIGYDNEKSISCFSSNQAKMEENRMQNCYLYYRNKLDLARQYITLGELEIAKKELATCISAYKSKKKIEISDVMKAYNLLGKIASVERNTKQMSQYFSSAYQTIVEFAMSQLFTMDENERAQFWETIKPVLNETLKECILHSKDDDSLAETAWNCSMLMKGLLLQSSNSIRDIVYDIGDSSLISQYEQILEEKSSHQITQNLTEDVNNNTRELELLHDPRISRKLDQVKRNFFVKCNDIQDFLGKDDIAIEFTEIENQFNDHSIITDEKQYWAIILTAAGKPTCVQLFREKQLKSISQIVDSRLYQLVWKPLISQIQGKSNIFFSPSGVLHKFPIEYLSSSDGNIMAEQYNIRRLSSTKELLNKQASKLDHIVLFGGLDYYVDARTWKQWELEAQAQTASGQKRGYISPAKISRGAIKLTLEGSKREVEFIDSFLREKKIKCELYESDKGSEQRFRSLSGADVSVLHISTHGFVDLTSEQSSNEYTLLNQTSLWLAGAADAFSTPDIIPEGVNDGILTAREIVSLDLRSVNLVVLSACQTGVGAINSDGVFGLQRGFKKAGAQSILMSLRDVYDIATENLMKEFYINIYEFHLSPHDALIQAQITIRQKGWEDPEYWAPFILLDGLD